MLHTETVQPGLLALLEKLMRVDSLMNYNLVGGTALALYIGHRLSIDIDLFGSGELDTNNVVADLSDLGDLKTIQLSKNIKIFELNKIKLDIVTYQYRLIQKPLLNNFIRIASKEDISAMKLNAISGRGSKKDFIDLYFLLKEFSLKEIMDFYLQKYSSGSEFMVYKSLTYFDDANKQPMPEMISQVDWSEIKNYISDETGKLNI
ncbi:MAG TPA: nucleotidyl transferase AbiEii/AbiGii toxin family protein [Saprospiraceae bacterium]|nr:nucleotidyl transferase AbiEii/AbiGii toxin family protein [Saprospiraceae bacterium]